jgi:hypothetical protein
LEKERRESRGKDKKRGKEASCKSSFPFPSLLTWVYSLAGGGGFDCALLHDEGLLSIQYPFFLERFQRKLTHGSEHATFESSLIAGELRIQRLPAALPVVNKLFMQLLQHYTL